MEAKFEEIKEGFWSYVKHAQSVGNFVVAYSSEMISQAKQATDNVTNMTLNYLESLSGYVKRAIHDVMPTAREQKWFAKHINRTKAAYSEYDYATEDEYFDWLANKSATVVPDVHNTTVVPFPVPREQIEHIHIKKETMIALGIAGAAFVFALLIFCLLVMRYSYLSGYRTGQRRSGIIPVREPDVEAGNEAAEATEASASSGQTAGAADNTNNDNAANSPEESLFEGQEHDSNVGGQGSAQTLDSTVDRSLTSIPILRNYNIASPLIFASPTFHLSMLTQYRVCIVAATALMTSLQVEHLTNHCSDTDIRNKLKDMDEVKRGILYGKILNTGKKWKATVRAKWMEHHLRRMYENVDPGISHTDYLEAEHFLRETMTKQILAKLKANSPLFRQYCKNAEEHMGVADEIDSIVATVCSHQDAFLERICYHQASRFSFREAYKQAASSDSKFPPTLGPFAEADHLRKVIIGYLDAAALNELKTTVSVDDDDDGLFVDIPLSDVRHSTG